MRARLGTWQIVGTLRPRKLTRLTLHRVAGGNVVVGVGVGVVFWVTPGMHSKSEHTHVNNTNWVVISTKIFVLYRDTISNGTTRVEHSAQQKSSRHKGC